MVVKRTACCTLYSGRLKDDLLELLVSLLTFARVRDRPGYFHCCGTGLSRAS